MSDLTSAELTPFEQFVKDCIANTVEKYPDKVQETKEHEKIIRLICENKWAVFYSSYFQNVNFRR
jgi:hypothetical protein